MSDQQIELYRRTALKFIESNSKDLIRIYLANREQEKGILAINLSDIDTTNNIDVAYMPLNILPEELLKIISDRTEINNENIVYFLLITPYEEKVVEFDIRTLNEIK